MTRVSAVDPPKPAATQADRIVILKKDHQMQLLRGGAILRTYRVSLGGEPLGPKHRQGDHKTPEGTYVIDRRNANSKFHLALHISYPNADDRKRAAAAGYDPGGDIMIHGLPNGFGWVSSSQHLMDWTDGCIAVTNKEIEEVWSMVTDGTPVEIMPQHRRPAGHAELWCLSCRARTLARVETFLVFSASSALIFLHFVTFTEIPHPIP